MRVNPWESNHFLERVFFYFFSPQNAGMSLENIFDEKNRPFLLKISGSGSFSRNILWYIAKGRKNVGKKPRTSSKMTFSVFSSSERHDRSLENTFDEKNQTLSIESLEF
jgi:hypothetical protein